MKKTVKDMVDEAMAEVETISVAEAMKRQDDNAFVIVDIARRPRARRRRAAAPKQTRPRT